MNIKILEIDELQSGTRKSITINNQSIVIFRLANGEYYAIDNVCPHAGIPLDDGELCGQTITCIWHHWAFDITNGECVTHENINIKTYNLELKPDGIYCAV